MVRFGRVGLQALAVAAFLWSAAGTVAAQPATGTSPRLQAHLKEGEEIEAQLTRAAGLACLDPDTLAVLSNTVAEWRSKLRRLKERPLTDYLVDLSIRVGLDELRKKPPCPPDRPAVMWSGPSVGVYGLITSNTMRVNERLAGTATTTFQSADSAGGAGFGFDAGYHIPIPGGPNALPGLYVSPFVAIDLPNTTVEHRFNTGAFYSQRTNAVATAGLDLGFSPTPGMKLFLRGGVSAVDTETKLFFGGPVQTERDWIPAGTFGVGVAYEIPDRPDAIRYSGAYTRPFGPVNIVASIEGRAAANRTYRSGGFDYRFDQTSMYAKVGVSWSPSGRLVTGRSMNLTGSSIGGR